MTDSTDAFLAFCWLVSPWWLLFGAAGTAHVSSSYWNRPRKETWVPAEDGGCQPLWLDTFYSFHAVTWNF